MSNCHFEDNTCKSERGSLCKRFAEILGAEILESRGNLCAVTFNRNLNVEILGRRTHSPLVLAALFSFESRRNNRSDRDDRCDRDDRNNEKTLNLGETVILPEEVNEFITVLRENGILITALHNHWLFEEPRLMYIHFESIDEPLEFARKVARALKVLKRC
jgi:hypothetical protein